MLSYFAEWPRGRSGSKCSKCQHPAVAGAIEVSRGIDRREPTTAPSRPSRVREKARLPQHRRFAGATGPPPVVGETMPPGGGTGTADGQALCVIDDLPVLRRREGHCPVDGDRDRDARHVIGIADTRSAYHEAGHAFWAHQLGFRIVFVSIIPDADTLGRVRATDWVLDHVAANQPERLVEAVTASLAVKLGGPLAELVLQPGKNRRIGNDYAEARAILRYANIPDLDKVEVLARAELTVLRGLERYWDAVCALAEALLEAGIVDGPQAHRILVAAMAV
jgi:hypothetical protein